MSYVCTTCLHCLHCVYVQYLRIVYFPCYEQIPKKKQVKQGCLFECTVSGSCPSWQRSHSSRNGGTCSQEAETCAQPGTPDYGRMPPTSVNPLYRFPHRHTQRLASQVGLEPGSLTGLSLLPSNTDKELSRSLRRKEESSPVCDNQGGLSGGDAA